MAYNDIPFKCSCGREFPAPGPLTTHRRTCSGSLKRLAGVLLSSKDIFSSRKKRRADALAAVLVAPQPEATEGQSLDESPSQLGIPVNLTSTLPLGRSGIQDPLEENAPAEVRAAYTPSISASF